MPKHRNITDIGYAVVARPAEARRTLEQLLEEYGGNATQAADAVGVSRRTFDRWLARFDLLERAAEIRARIGAKDP